MPTTPASPQQPFEPSQTAVADLFRQNMENAIRLLAQTPSSQKTLIAALEAVDVAAEGARELARDDWLFRALVVRGNCFQALGCAGAASRCHMLAVALRDELGLAEPIETPESWAWSLPSGSFSSLT